MVREQSENGPRMVRDGLRMVRRLVGPKACQYLAYRRPSETEAYPRMLRIVQVSTKPARGVRDELDKVVQHDWRLG